MKRPGIALLFAMVCVPAALAGCISSRHKLFNRTVGHLGCAEAYPSSGLSAADAAELRSYQKRHGLHRSQLRIAHSDPDYVEFTVHRWSRDEDGRKTWIARCHSGAEYRCVDNDGAVRCTPN